MATQRSLTVYFEIDGQYLYTIKPLPAQQGFSVGKVSPTTSDPLESSYWITVDKDSEEPRLQCNCLGFVNHGHCKHTAALFKFLSLCNQILKPEVESIS